MQIIEIKPSNSLQFKVPSSLTAKFVVGNLSLRSVCIHVVSLHPHAVSCEHESFIVDAFQEAEVTCLLHWSQQTNTDFKTKIRVYIWEMYDDEPLGVVAAKMFGKETDGCCLMFEEITVTLDIDTKYLRKITSAVPSAYSIDRILLPGWQAVEVSEQMWQRVLSHCQKVSKVKAIYTFGARYVVEFAHLDDVIGSFCELRDDRDRLALFGIGCIPSLDKAVFSPEIITLNPDFDYVDYQVKREKIPRESIMRKREPEHEQNIREIHMEALCEEQAQKYEPKADQPRVQQEQEEGQIKEIVASRAKQVNYVKQSFMVGQSSRVPGRKRTKSEQFSQPFYHEEEDSTEVDMTLISQWKAAEQEKKKPRQFEQKTIDVSKKILNMCLSGDERYLYVLVRDCVIIYEIGNLSNKRVIKFDPIDVENINLPTPMLMFKETLLVFANESYLFWVPVSGEAAPDWKYVQRKEIYTVEVINELNLLMVGGKNFSKLSYLGKSTSRSNIKVYSCSLTGTKDHLFTYDLPNCNGDNVMEIKYASTRPNSTKLLLVLTNLNKLFFLRVKAFNNIEVYSCMEVNEMGIQQIVSLNYLPRSSMLICLEKLSEDLLCFKYIKINCAYEKIEIATESVKLPVAKYEPIFRLGGSEGNEWITAVDSSNFIYSLYLEWKEPQKTDYKGPIRDCLLVEKGAIFRENSQLRFRVVRD